MAAYSLPRPRNAAVAVVEIEHDFVAEALTRWCDCVLPGVVCGGYFECFVLGAEYRV
jgi:hypothetical protein